MTNEREDLLTEEERGKNYARMHFAPSVEDRFSGTKVTDCNDEMAMELIMNHHCCSGDDGFLSSS